MDNDAPTPRQTPMARPTSAQPETPTAGETSTAAETSTPPQAAAASQAAQRAAPRGRLRLLVFVLLACAVGTVAFLYRDALDATRLAGYKQQLDALRGEQPWLVYGVAFGVYVAVTALSIPGAAAMSVLYGAAFGFVRTVILVSFASTTGATLAFLVSRYLLRDFVHDRFGRQLQRIDAALQREGAFYLFLLRLVPAVPFFVLNLVMGLTPLSTRTFWWVSQLGMLPGTCVYVYAGATIDLQRVAAQGLRGLVSWQLLLAFALLGLFPLVVRKLVGAWRRRAHGADRDGMAPGADSAEGAD
jgi:uncharacterized membrane protein YdjX (TVP38/TMEM64 family)